MFLAPDMGLGFDSLCYGSQVGQAVGVPRPHTEDVPAVLEVLVALVDAAGRESLRIQPALEFEIPLSTGAREPEERHVLRAPDLRTDKLRLRTPMPFGGGLGFVNHGDCDGVGAGEHTV